MSGTPSSLLKFPSEATVRRCGAQSVARMSFVVVLPVAPVMPTTRAVRAVADGAADRGERGVRVVGDERRRGSAGERVRDEVVAAADGDEEVALLDPPRVDLHAGDLARPRAGGEPAERLDQVELERDHRRAAFLRARSRATSRSSNGTFPVASSCSGSAPRPAITTMSPGPASSSASSIAARRSSSMLELAERACRDLGGDRLGRLRARVVGGQDRPVGELGDDAAHQRPLAAVAVAAGAEDDDEPPVAEAARGADHVLERVGRVRVVDDHGERLPVVDRLEPARERPRPTRCPRRIASSSTPSARAASAAPIAFSRLKAPAQRQLDPVERVGVAASKVIASGMRRREPPAPTRRRR